MMILDIMNRNNEYIELDITARALINNGSTSIGPGKTIAITSAGNNKDEILNEIEGAYELLINKWKKERYNDGYIKPEGLDIDIRAYEQNNRKTISWKGSADIYSRPEIFDIELKED